MTARPTLLTPAAYVADAIRHIDNAKHSISFISMVINDDQSTADIIDSLAEAAKRGVKVQVAADMFTYTELSGQFIPSHYFSKKVRSATRLAKELTNAGAHFYWLGRLSATTFSGRTHSKWCVVDDIVYSFGGVNLYDKGIASNDLMFRISDQGLADRLEKEQKKIVAADSGKYAYRSRSFNFDDLNTVLIDGGILGESIIYRRACKLASEASKVTVVSQYCPTGKLSQILRARDTEFYFNPWQRAQGFNKLIIRVGSFLSRHQTLYTKTKYLHAKFMIFTMNDGSRVAITGSHNFVNGGVLLGTREIALESRDSEIINQLQSFFDKYIA